MPTGYQKGFTTLDREVMIDRLPVTGRVPGWLKGILVRNGPGRFEVGNEQYSHWFDGLGMLHRFSFKDGAVSYANKYLQSRDYTESMAKGRIALSTFGTEPRRTFFELVRQKISAKFSDNGSVNVARIGGRHVALTETPLPYEFDLHTLETLGPFDYGRDAQPGVITTAHPHFDFNRSATVNYIIEFGPVSKYHVYAIPSGQAAQTLIGSLRAREPSYMHSFGMTENHVILTEFPLVVNPLRLRFSGRPFIENYKWKPGLGTRFVLMSKRDGSVRSFDSEAFFAFHHINAFEQNGDVFVDIAAKPDATIIDALYLDRLRAGVPAPAAEFRRYRLPTRGSTATHERLSNELIDLPRINYERCNCKDYRFAYGFSNRQDLPTGFPNQLLKVDVRERRNALWFADECFPGEPVFVSSPGAASEDEGVVLCVVLDGRKGNSFLLILDAGSFTELARAEAPHHIPFGFHGQFFADSGS
jgi:carotenoid cleavage dioxygenase-like enzyme